MRSIAFIFTCVVMFASGRVGFANSEYRAQSGFTALATEVPMASSEDRVPLGFSMLVIDIPCKHVINSIPKRLEELGVVFEWADKDEGSLTVGPFEEKPEVGLVYTTIRQTYFLKTTCDNELMVSITGEATLEGLQSDGQWIGITDSKTIEQHSLEFFRKLDL